MTVSTFYPTGYDSGSSWTNQGNIYADDTSVANITASSKNVTYELIGNVFKTGGVTIADTIPAGSTVNSVTITAVHANGTNDSSGPLFWLIAYDGGTTIGTGTQDTTGTTSEETYTYDGTTPTLTQLRSSTFKVGINFRRSDNTAHTHTCDYVKVVVDWSAAAMNGSGSSKVQLPVITAAGSVERLATGSLKLQLPVIVDDATASQPIGTGSAKTQLPLVGGTVDTEFPYVSSLTTLSGGTTYHVRAYATNSSGTAYGSEVDFTTVNQGTGGLKTQLPVIGGLAENAGPTMTGDGSAKVQLPVITGTATVERLATGSTRMQLPVLVGGATNVPPARTADGSVRLQLPLLTSGATSPQPIGTGRVKSQLPVVSGGATASQPIGTGGVKTQLPLLTGAGTSPQPIGSGSVKTQLPVLTGDATNAETSRTGDGTAKPQLPVITGTAKTVVTSDLVTEYVASMAKDYIGYKTIGDSWATLGANDQDTSELVVDAPCTVSEFWVYMRNTGSAAYVRPGVYADNGGTPNGGALLAQGDPVQLSAGQSAGWVRFTLSSPLTLSAGTVWPTIHGDANAGGVGYTYRSSATGWSVYYVTRTYTSGLLDPLTGASEAASRQSSIYFPAAVPGNNTDPTSTWDDLIGNNDGTLTSFGWTSTDGWTGDGTASTPYALHFDASGELLDLGDVAVGEGQYTYEVWFSAEDTAANKAMLSAGDSADNDSTIVLYVQSSGILSMYHRNTAGTYVQVSSSASVEANGWHHGVGTFDGTTLRLYLDGSEVGTPATPSGSVTLNKTVMGVWFHGTTYEMRHSGSIATARTYSRALTSSEVARNYNAGVLAHGPKAPESDDRTGTGVLRVQSPLLSGTATVERLASGSEKLQLPLVGGGATASQPIGTGLVKTQLPVLIGTGTASQPIGTGQAKTQLPVLSGSGTVQRLATGTEKLQLPLLSGGATNTPVSNDRTGTGVLRVQSPLLTGTATVSRSATGLVKVQSPLLNGTATVSRSASGRVKVQLPLVGGTASATSVSARTGDADGSAVLRRYESDDALGSAYLAGIGSMPFVSQLTDLTPGTRYYVRAYANLSSAPVEEPPTYYVKNGGNDALDGLSEETAWATVARVIAASPSPGQSIGFRRGDTWREPIYLHNTSFPSGTSAGQITFRGYGTGAKPKFLGGNDMSSGWTNTSGNIWRWDTSTGTLENCALHMDNETLHGRRKTSSTMTTQGDFYWSGGYTYLYSVSDPATYYDNIEGALARHGFHAGTKSYLTVSGLDFRYWGSGGISSYPSTNHIYEYNDLSWIGPNTASFQAGNGIGGQGTRNDIIRYNRIHQVLDAGLSTINYSTDGTLSGNTFYGNIVSNCEYGYEQQSYDTGDYSNIHITGNVFYKMGDTIWHPYRPDPTGKGLQSWSHTGVTPSGCLFDNNIVYGSVHSHVRKPAVGWSCSGNRYYADGATMFVVYGGSSYNFAGWQTAGNDPGGSLINAITGSDEEILATLEAMLSEVEEPPTYYVKNGGNDSLDGLSDATAWATVAKVLSRTYSPGQSIAFKRGDTWRGGITGSGNTTKAGINLHEGTFSSGTTGSPITLRAYGTGDKPKFIGSTNVSSSGSWIDQGSNKWRWANMLSPEIVNVLYGDGATPEPGVFYVDPVVGVNKDSVVALSAQGEWYYDPVTDYLYIYSTSNPGTYYSAIEAVHFANGINVGTRHDLVVKDLAFQNWGRHGLLAYYGYNLLIENLEICWIGGYGGSISVELGNGMEFDGTHDVIVRYNRLDQIWDAAFSPYNSPGRMTSNQTFYGNVASRGRDLWEVQTNGATDGTGPMDNIEVYDNVFYDGGGNYAADIGPNANVGCTYQNWSLYNNVITGCTFHDNYCYGATLYQGVHQTSGWTHTNNHYYPGELFRLRGGSNMSLAAFQALGYELGSEIMDPLTGTWAEKLAALEATLSGSVETIVYGDEKEFFSGVTSSVTGSAALYASRTGDATGAASLIDSEDVSDTASGSAVLQGARLSDVIGSAILRVEEDVFHGLMGLLFHAYKALRYDADRSGSAVLQSQPTADAEGSAVLLVVHGTATGSALLAPLSRFHGFMGMLFHAKIAGAVEGEVTGSAVLLAGPETEVEGSAVLLKSTTGDATGAANLAVVLPRGVYAEGSAVLLTVVLGSVTGGAALAASLDDDREGSAVLVYWRSGSRAGSAFLRLPPGESREGSAFLIYAGVSTVSGSAMLRRQTRRKIKSAQRRYSVASMTPGERIAHVLRGKRIGSMQPWQ